MTRKMMHRTTIAVALIALWAILLGCFTLLSGAAANSLIRGDADGDGKVTVLDATTIQRKLANLEVSSFVEKAADVDGNGLDVLDATRIQRNLAGFTDPYQIGEPISDATQPTKDPYELPFVPTH